MKLKDIANVVQGVNFARVETNETDPNAIEQKLLTLREFNETIGLPYRLGQDKKTSIWVPKEKCEKLTFTKEGVVIIHLLSQTAAMIPKKYEGILIPSNFVLLEFYQQVDAKFMEWYFNEHPLIRRQLMISTQGTSVSALSINMLREMEVSLPPLETQKVIGKMTGIFKKKKKLMQERMHLEERLIHYQILDKMEEYKW